MMNDMFDSKELKRSRISHLKLELSCQNENLIINKSTYMHRNKASLTLGRIYVTTLLGCFRIILKNNESAWLSLSFFPFFLCNVAVLFFLH